MKPSKTAPKRKTGRPKAEIDWKLVESLSQIQCTSREIASVLNVAHSTLTGREEFSDIYERGKESGKASLRRKQFRIAETNAVMAIWLGKQYLNQTDTGSVEDETGKNYTVTFAGS